MFEFRPVSKESQLHKERIKPKGKARGEFKTKTIQAIFERDEHKCVKCHMSSNLESVPHHITFKSQGGTGEKKNGATVCRDCHKWAHGLKKGPYGEFTHEGRSWFEMWRDEYLDANGDLVTGEFNDGDI